MFKFLKKAQEWSERKTEQIQQKQQERTQGQKDLAEPRLDILLNSEDKKARRTAWAELQNISWGYPSYRIDYVGGHFERTGFVKNIRILITSKGLVFSHIDGIIPIEDIKGVDYKSSEQVEKDVTLTRLVAFGIYAFALKKEKKTVENFVIINCEHKGLPYKIALSGSFAEAVYRDTFKTLADK